MRAESIYQFLVPLGFIAIWALTSLFNRDTQPLPPRTNRPPGPNQGPRPTPSASSAARPSPSDWRPEVNPPLRGGASPPRAGAGPQPAFPSGRAGDRRDDEILIIEAEPRRPSAPAPSPRLGTPVPSRRGARPRPAPQPAPRRPEPPTPRTLGDPLTRNSAPSNVQSEALKPLVLPPSPLLSTPNNEAAKAQAVRAGEAERDSFSSAEIRPLAQTPARLREGFILAELLKPPVSLRPSRLARPRPPKTS